MVLYVTWGLALGRRRDVTVDSSRLDDNHLLPKWRMPGFVATESQDQFKLALKKKPQAEQGVIHHRWQVYWLVVGGGLCSAIGASCSFLGARDCRFITW